MDAIKTLCAFSTAVPNLFHGVTLFAGRLHGIKSRCAVCASVILASLLQITALAGISGSWGHSWYSGGAVGVIQQYRQVCRTRKGRGVEGDLRDTTTAWSFTVMVQWRQCRFCTCRTTLSRIGKRSTGSKVSWNAANSDDLKFDFDATTHKLVLCRQSAPSSKKWYWCEHECLMRCSRGFTFFQGEQPNRNRKSSRQHVAHRCGRNTLHCACITHKSRCDARRCWTFALAQEAWRCAERCGVRDAYPTIEQY